MPNSPNTQNPSGTSLNFSLLGLQSHRICLCFANTLILDVTISKYRSFAGIMERPHASGSESFSFNGTL